MKATAIVTEKDYYIACSIINKIESVAPVKSPMAAGMVKTASKVIEMYKQQKFGIKPTCEIKNPSNLLAQHIQNANLFMEIRIAKSR